MQIAVLLSAAVPSPPGSVPAAEGEVSFDAHLQAVQAQQETPPEPSETAAHPAPEVIPVPPPASAETETEVEVVPPAELLPSAVPIQEWEALAWVQQHVPPVVAPPPVAAMAPPLPAAPVPPPQSAVPTAQDAVAAPTEPPAVPPGPTVNPQAEAPVTPAPPEAEPAPPAAPPQAKTVQGDDEMPAPRSASSPAPASGPEVAPRSGPPPQAEEAPDKPPEKAEAVDTETPMPAPPKSEPPAPLRSAAPITPAPLNLTPPAAPPLAQAAGLALEKPLRAIDSLSPAPAPEGLPPNDLRAPLRAEEGAAALGLSLASPARPRELAEAAAAPRTQTAVAARFELVQQMGERIRLSHHQGAQEVRVSLNPAHLGQVDVHLSRHEGHYSLHMIAETPLAKELLESQLGQLKQHLGQQGLLLEQASVDLGGQSEQGKQPAQEQPVPTGAAAAFKLFPDADDTQEDGVPAALPAPDSAVNYLA